MIKSVGEEHKVVKSRREYQAVEKNKREKRERGSNIIFPITLRLLGRISSEERGKRRIIWGRKKKKKRKNIKL